ncbi:MAG: glutaredoxin [Desulfovibrionaceae bacterium]|nr:glutaredoxin [Desulfovibrionaceae bacterium]
MAEIIIYGKAGCPHTRRALDAHPDAKFRDVLLNPADMEDMLRYSDGRRRVPVIVENGQATVGYNRGS